MQGRSGSQTASAYTAIGKPSTSNTVVANATATSTRGLIFTSNGQDPHKYYQPPAAADSSSQIHHQGMITSSSSMMIH